MATSFAVSSQHYVFNVQSFAQMVLSLGGDEYTYALRDRTTKGVITDVQRGASEIGVLMETTENQDQMESVFSQAGLQFVCLTESTPRVALPASHPLLNASELELDQLDDYPYIYFQQEDDAPAFFAEEAMYNKSGRKVIACTDRASLSELIAALNGYTITSGILVGISDGKGLGTVALKTDVRLRLGYVKKACAPLSDPARVFVEKLEKNLVRYAF